MQFMSSLDRDFDSDQLSLYAPKRVREAARAERGSLAPNFPEGIGAGDTQRPTATPAPSDGHLAIDGTCLLRSLEPTLIAELCPVPPARFSLSVLARFACAVVIAAIVAPFVLSKLPTS